MGLSQIACVAGGVALVAAQLVWTIGLWLCAAKGTKLSRALGGDPPDYFGRYFLWGPVPEFWEYLRQQDRLTRDAELASLTRKAEVLLVLRMVVMVPLVLVILGSFIVGSFRR